MTITIDKENLFTPSQISKALEVVTVTAEGLDSLGVKPTYIVGKARYYEKTAVAEVKAALVQWLQKPEPKAPETSPF